MRPTVGRIVHFRSENPDQVSNGADLAPAIITRVWSDTCVTLTVFRDGETPIAVTSVDYSESYGQGLPPSWHWPA